MLAPFLKIVHAVPHNPLLTQQLGIFFLAVLGTVYLNFCILLFQDNGAGLLAKAELTGNVILSKVVCSYTAYDNASLKMYLFGIRSVVPGILWQLSLIVLKALPLLPCW